VLADGWQFPDRRRADISCLIAASGEDCEPDLSAYKVDIEGIVGANSSIGSPAYDVLSLDIEIAAEASFCAGSAEPFAVCLKASMARAARSSNFSP
jgi:hypothetical protein